MAINYFPLGLAQGRAFCNRQTERNRIKANIEQHTATLLSSPRRYGKTSLALQTIHETKLPYAHVDFFADIDELEVERSIMRGIGNILVQLEKGPKKAWHLVSEFFSGMHVKIVLEKVGLSVDLEHERTGAVNNIKEALLKLNKVTEQYKQPVVLFLDEFQRVYEVEKNHSIEAAIRFVAQQPSNVSYIFSGSNRHMLLQMFMDRNRPFYRMCDHIALQRIHADDYAGYIQKVASKHWKGQLDVAVVEEVLTLTQRHPYYVNVLCSRLWQQAELPTAKLVLSIWASYIMEERSRVETELDLLSFNQKRLLIALVKYGQQFRPMSSEFVARSGIPLASIRQSLSVLQKLDYVYEDERQQYRLIDPVIEALVTSF